MEPSFQIKPPRPPWTRRELFAWLAVVLLAAGIFLQHLRLEKLSRDLYEKTETVERAAEKRMIERLTPLKERIEQAERQVRACLDAVEKSGP